LGREVLSGVDDDGERGGVIGGFGGEAEDEKRQDETGRHTVLQRPQYIEFA
jgi:hypothetical protein